MLYSAFCLFLLKTTLSAFAVICDKDDFGSFANCMPMVWLTGIFNFILMCLPNVRKTKLSVCRQATKTAELSSHFINNAHNSLSLPVFVCSARTTLNQLQADLTDGGPHSLLAQSKEKSCLHLQIPQGPNSLFAFAADNVKTFLSALICSFHQRHTNILPQLNQSEHSRSAKWRRGHDFDVILYCVWLFCQARK